MANGELIEKVADEIDEVAVHVEEVAEVTRRLTGREVGFFVAGAGIGVAVGFGVGYFVMGKRLETKYEKLAKEEIAEMREHYTKKMVAAQSKPPANVIVEERQYDEKELQAIEETNRRFPPEKETPMVEETPQVSNIFEDPWDYAVEIKKRQHDVPYIIHYDEFQQNEPENEQVTYTYYELDDVLADIRDTEIDDMDAVIGLGNLGRWGHGSNDENIVYVRNEYLSLDVEIVRDRGSFAEETRRNIKHSQDRRRRPNRKFDDE